MSITDPIHVELWERGPKGERTLSYILMRGRETFYDEGRRIREWKTQEQAETWLYNFEQERKVKHEQN